MVALTVAEAGGLHGGEALQFGRGLFSNKTTRWLAHRRLLWRSLRFAKQRKCPPPIDNCTGAEWAEALKATTERSVMAMVAAARRRAHCAPVVEDILEEDVAEGLCALYGAGAGGIRPRRARSWRSGKSDERVLVHQACASCSSEVYFDMQSRLCNVLRRLKEEEASSAPRVEKCSRPKKSGATAGCSVASCKRSYHVRCCLDTAGPSGPNKTFSVPSIEGRTTTRRTSEDWWKFDCPVRPEGPETSTTARPCGSARSAGRGSTRPARAARGRGGARRPRVLPLPRAVTPRHGSPSPIVKLESVSLAPLLWLIPKPAGFIMPADAQFAVRRSFA